MSHIPSRTFGKASLLGFVRPNRIFHSGPSLTQSGICLALGEPAERPVGATHVGRHAPLAKREAEVAGLVADGLTNKQIGSRLFISERTVENHVRSIINKLGFSSRAQIASWIAAPGD